MIYLKINIIAQAFQKLHETHSITYFYSNLKGKLAKRSSWFIFFSYTFHNHFFLNLSAQTKSQSKNSYCEGNVCFQFSPSKEKRSTVCLLKLQGITQNYETYTSSREKQFKNLNMQSKIKRLTRVIFRLGPDNIILNFFFFYFFITISLYTQHFKASKPPPNFHHNIKTSLHHSESTWMT